MSVLGYRLFTLHFNSTLTPGQSNTMRHKQLGHAVTATGHIVQSVLSKHPRDNKICLLKAYTCFIQVHSMCLPVLGIECMLM